MSKETFYITTPIYYPSGNWHIGTCYTTVVCDSLARFNRMLNKEVFYLTGTDEHGQKVEGKARELGVTPKEFVDPIVEDLKKIWEILDISYDRFIRTTDDYHVAAVQKIFKKLYDNGDIYKSTYEGWYCTPCESFWTDTQLVDGKCPDCGREVHKETEESYFFRLSKYADKILKLYEDNPEFLQPKSRMNEMINNFIRPGLQDLCVSRTSIKWGVPVDFDEKHTVYVWIDALSNYITALGYASEDDSLYKKFWPCDIHMTGKEIIRFHAIIWPAILMSLGEEVPKKVYGHGWLLIGGDKLSKSKEGKIATELTDPKDFVARYGSDPLRYYLLREIPFGSDGAYTNEAFLNRLNSDLANDLGNLVSRTTAMINQYFGGALPKQGELEEVDKDLISVAEGMLGKVKAAMESLNVPDALVEIFRLIGRANKYIDETMPWILAKDPDKKERLGTVLYNLAESIRFAATVLKCYLTKAPAKILALFGIDEKSVKDFSSLDKFGWLKEGTIIEKSQPIFPRIDVKKELAAIDEMMIARHKEKEKSANKPENSK
ncbi:MAG: methionine--tRNA ligase, partial [Clostridia bacterium]|nr:methionine--tRNA ligase [Clostridia bacterium]